MLLRTRDRFVRAMGAAGVCVALWGCKAAPIVGDDPDEIVKLFGAELVDSKLFLDPFAGAKFAHYFTKAHRVRVSRAFVDMQESARFSPRA